MYLQLNTPANTTHVCLNADDARTSFIEKKDCFVTGWGRPTYQSRQSLRKKQERCEQVQKAKGLILPEHICDDSDTFSVLKRHLTWSAESLETWYLHYYAYRNYMDKDNEVCPLQRGFPLNKADTVLQHAANCSRGQSIHFPTSSPHFCVITQQNITQQVDTGSPIVCKTHKTKSTSRTHKEAPAHHKYAIVGFVSKIMSLGLENETVIATSINPHKYQSDVLNRLSKQKV